MNKLILISDNNKGQKLLSTFFINIGLIVQDSLDIHNLPDIVLMDINHIELGDSICLNLRATSDEIPVIIYCGILDCLPQKQHEINQFEPWNKVYEIFIEDQVDPIKIFHILNMMRN